MRVCYTWLDFDCPNTVNTNTRYGCSQSMRSQESMENLIDTDYMRMAGQCPNQLLQSHPSMASHARPLHGGYNFDERRFIPEMGEIDIDSCDTDSWTWARKSVPAPSTGLPNNAVVPVAVANAGGNSMDVEGARAAGTAPSTVQQQSITPPQQSTQSFPLFTEANKRGVAEGAWPFSDPVEENPMKRVRFAPGFNPPQQPSFFNMPVNTNMN